MSKIVEDDLALDSQNSNTIWTDNHCQRDKEFAREV